MRKPIWRDLELTFNVLSIRSIVNVRIFHRKTGGEPQLACSYTGSIEDLASSASHDLMKDGRAVSQLSVQLSYQLKDGIPVHDERAFSKFVHPLTQALSGIEELAVLVREVRGIPKPDEICYTAWQRLASVYRILLIRRICDPHIKKLSVSLRYMLAFATDDCTLERLDGRLDIIEDMAIAIHLAAEIIQGWVDSLISIEAITVCENRLLFLYKRFNHTFDIQAWAAAGIIFRNPSRREREHVEEVATSTDLQAGYKRMEGCLAGTRTKIIDDILLSLHDTSSESSKIIWLEAPPGAGKSAIAATVCRLLDESGHLGGTFFASSLIGTLRKPQNVFGAIASELTGVYPLGDAVWNTITRISDLWESSIRDQFRELLVRPVAADPLGVPLVLVLDGLDELTEPRAVLEAIHAEITNLPSSVKFFITSRPEQSIQAGMNTMGRMVTQLHLDQDSGIEDIRAFISRRLEPGWPGRTACEALAHKSAGSFMWASTAVKLLEDDTGVPNSQLQSLLELDAHVSYFSPDLDKIYAMVLTLAFFTESAVAVVRKAVGALTAVEVPLSAITRDVLFGPRSESYDVMLLDDIRPFGKALSISETESMDAARRRCLDFLSDPHLSPGETFLADVTHQHHLLADSCLRVMDALLTVNICRLSPSLLLSEVEDLQTCVAKHIPKTLRYACLFWACHLSYTPPNNDIRSLVHEFYLKNFPMWLEVMSLLGYIKNSGRYSLVMVHSWLQQFNDPQDDLLQLASSSANFLTEFLEPISTSPTHIYYSFLPFLVHQSPLYRTYSATLKDQMPVVTREKAAEQSISEPQTIESFFEATTIAFSPDGRHIFVGSLQGNIHIWDIATASWMKHTSQGHRDAITCIVFSADSLRLASGSRDGDIWLWDGVTRNAIRELLRYHRSAITDLSFSPNGKSIVSSSEDKTVRLWDGVTGAPIGAVITGHPGVVSSVVFSPDGTRVVSGSEDCTLRLWDGVTGSQIGDALRGHSGSIRSVAYSPDRTRFVSASEDCTLRLWDGVTGTAIGSALRCHSGPICSVAFSSDGTRFVSASEDCMLRLLNGVTRELIGDALRGHSGRVRSVAFSPNGRLVVSGSEDCTLRLWNGVTGASVGGPLRGHSGTILSVAYSPAGTHFVSASDDHTLRLWDGVTGATQRVLRSHSDAVSTVAFSPDGMHVVSGSDDKTIRLWHVGTGAQIGGALIGHSGGVTSVMFSPNGARIVSASDDFTLRLWNGNTGEPLGDALTGHSGYIRSVAYSSDGSCIVSGSHDRTLRLWDGITGAPRRALGSHSDSVSTVAFSSDGRAVRSESESKEILWWDAKSFRRCEARKEYVKCPPTPCFSEEHPGWLIVNGKKILWVPEAYRENAVYAYSKHGYVAIACKSEFAIIDGSMLDWWKV